MKYVDNGSKGKYIQYKDVDGVTCYTKYKYRSVGGFKNWCKENGVCQLKNFTDIKFKEE